MTLLNNKKNTNKKALQNDKKNTITKALQNDKKIPLQRLYIMVKKYH